MAKLKDRMRVVANKLISEYGNNCVLYKKVLASPVYNPALDEYVGVSNNITVNTFCTYRDLTLTEMQDSDSGSVSKVAVIPYSEDIDTLDTQWTIDGNKIIKISKSNLQNGTITYTVYVG